MEISAIIKELNKLIKAKYDDFQGSYLYGSRVNGAFQENSDIDVVVLFEDMNNDKDLELSGIINDLLYKYGIYIDLQAYTPDKLERNPAYYKEVVQNGIFYAPA